MKNNGKLRLTAVASKHQPSGAGGSAENDNDPQEHTSPDPFADGETLRLWMGDCLEQMRRIPDRSVHLILCDPPYGTTACKWDVVIPFDALWAEYRRIITPTGVIVLTGSQPFSSMLVASNPEWFRYALVWKKTRKTGFLHAKNKPLKEHEDILVFSPSGAVHPHQSKRRMTYNPQGVVELEASVPSRNGRSSKSFGGKMHIPQMEGRKQTHTNFPTSVLEFPSVTKTVHPTQKPQSLCEYLVLTYSNPGDVVLDNCMGSGTTGLAALATGRKFIGIEREPEHFATAMGRIAEVYSQRMRVGDAEPPLPAANENDISEPARRRQRRRRAAPCTPAARPAKETPPVAPATTLVVVPQQHEHVEHRPANDERPLRYATVCSGIEGVSLAFEPLGMQPAFFSEVAPFPKAVLAHHWPNVPDLGDLAQIDGSKWKGKVDVLWGSLPCQSFSSIGQKKGLDDPRGALSLKFVNLANQIDPDIIVIENAKGLLSDRQAFNTLLQALCGPHDRPEGRFGSQGSVSGRQRRAAWRVLDALDFGLPQHRERVFLVATSVASGVDPAQLLDVGEGATRRSHPRRQDQSQAPKDDAEGVVWFVNGDTRPKVRCETTATLRAGTPAAYVVQGGVARHLLALEWERLQGIPDGHTAITWKEGVALDRARKKAIGNSLAVPVVRWIGERIVAATNAASSGVTTPKLAKAA